MVDPFRELRIDIVERALERGGNGSGTRECGGRCRAQDAVVGAGEERAARRPKSVTRSAMSAAPSPETRYGPPLAVPCAIWERAPRRLPHAPCPPKVPARTGLEGPVRAGMAAQHAGRGKEPRGAPSRDGGNASLNPCDQCLQCEYLDACGGGHLAQRWSPERNFDNPSVYCDSWKRIFEHRPRDGKWAQAAARNREPGGGVHVATFKMFELPRRQWCPNVVGRRQHN
jgi:hypothetical protein